MEAPLRAPEKVREASELQEIVLETEAGAVARGLRVAGGGHDGLFVKRLLKDSPAARALSLQEGDQLLSARVYFDNIKYEDALQILTSAEPYKISFFLKRVVPSADAAHKPGLRAPQAKVAKLNVRSMSFLKRRRRRRRGMKAVELRGPQALPPGKQELTPGSVEFFLPRFAKLLKARGAGRVAVTGPSPDISSLEAKHLRLRFPRLKVKEAEIARREGAGAHLSVGLPKAGAEPKEAVRRGPAEGKAFRFTIPFPKMKALKEEAGGKGEKGFQAPQVEFDLPLPKLGPSSASPKAASPGKTFRIPEVPDVEAALPKASAEGLLPTGLRLPTAEVEAPKLGLDLALPKLECVGPEVPPKKEGFRIKTPNFGVSAKEEEELKRPLTKALRETRRKAEDSEAAKPYLEVTTPAVALELSLPKGEAGGGVSEILAKVPVVGLLPTLSPSTPEGGGGKQPPGQASPGIAQGKSSVVQMPRLEISWLAEQPLEGKEGAPRAADSQPTFPRMKTPFFELLAPKVREGQQHSREDLPGHLGRVKSREDAEGVGFKFQMPQVSLLKFGLPAKAPPSPPPAHVRVPEPEGDTGAKISLPGMDLALPTRMLPDVQLPRAPKAELGDTVEKQLAPEGPVAPARLRLPSPTVPALEIELPQVGLDLDVPKGERPTSAPQVPRASETQLGGASLETLSKGLEVEISLPTCQMAQPASEPRARAPGGPEATGKGVKIPQVGLAFEKEAAETGRDRKGKTISGAKMKPPAVSLPEVTLQPGETLEAQTKPKPPRFALSKLSISSPQVWRKPPKSAAEGGGATGRALRAKGPKIGIAFPKSKGGGAKGEAAQEGPDLAVDLGLWGKEEEAGAGLDLTLFKGPKLSRAKPRGKGQLGKGSRASKFRVPSFGLRQRAGEARKAKARPKEKPQGSWREVSKWKRSPPRAAAGEKGAFQVQGPELSGTLLPKLELPTLGPRAEPGGVPEPESFRVQIPSLEIAVAAPRAEGELGRAAEGESHQGWSRGELKLLKAPSIGVSAPALELEVSLPAAREERGSLQGAPGTEAKLRLLGKGEEGGAEAGLEPPGPLLSLGKEGEKGLARVAEAFAPAGAAMQLPRVDIALPKVRLTDMELPRAKDPGLEGPEGKFQWPKISPPRLKAPELELDVGPKFKAKQLQSVVSGRGAERGGEVALPRAPQLEFKAPKLGGSSETLSSPLSQSGAGTEGSQFKLTIPSLSLSGQGAELSRETQPLCPAAGGADRAFQVAWPEVGFSVEQKGERGTEAAGEGGGLEGMLKMPQIGIPLGLGAGGAARGEGEITTAQSPRQGDVEEGKRPGWKVPALEISPPGLQSQAEEGVEGAASHQPWGSQRLEEEKAGWKRAEDSSGAPAGKRAKVKIPKFGFSLPKAGLEAPEGWADQEVDPKKPLFALGKGPEGSLELLEREEEEEEGRVARLKLKPTFGLSLSKTKPVAALNGDVAEASSRLKLPKLGFAKGEPGAAQSNREQAEGWSQEETSRLGKIRLPQVGLSPPSTEAGTDRELSLQLVRADEARDGPPSGPTLSAALRAPKFKSPRLALSGFRKWDRESPQVELAETAARFRLPKVALSSRSEGLLEVSGPQQGNRALNLSLPRVGFTAESSPGAAPPPERPGVKAEPAATVGV